VMVGLDSARSRATSTPGDHKKSPGISPGLFYLIGWRTKVVIAGLVASDSF